MADCVQVVELMASFPELEELHLMGNELSTIDSDPTNYLSNVKVGAVQETTLSSFAIIRLGLFLPLLCSLSLV